jgi:hypothetical protein
MEQKRQEACDTTATTLYLAPQFWQLKFVGSVCLCAIRPVCVGTPLRKANRIETQ